MSKGEHRHKILWIDDEIDLLKPHILFLNQKGYDVDSASSGTEALDLLAKDSHNWDIIMLDENMPGLSGLETLERLKLIASHLPVIMITKSEEENIMDQAVGNQIADYLIKPVNPRQILSSLKKILHGEQLVTEQAANSYRREFLDISNLISQASTFVEWSEIYRRLTLRSIEFGESAPDLAELLRTQLDEANKGFFRFISRNYLDWIAGQSEDAPILSHKILENFVLPKLNDGKKVVLMLIDNLRLDQWIALRPLILDIFDIERENTCSALLPTATQYCRNAIFSGLLPLDIRNRFPELWVDEDSPESKNLNEEPLLQNWLDSKKLSNLRLKYYKANDSAALQKILKEYNPDSFDLSVVVINFIDILSHSRTDSMMIKELASNDAAYRSLSASWFRHSPIRDLLRKIAVQSSPTSLILTTDHGSVRVTNPVKVIGDRDTNDALRYKVGKNLSFPSKDVFEIKSPTIAGLPSPFLSASYICARPGDYFVYPNNFNHYSSFYQDSYQHGGISLEEMILPVVTLKNKS